MTKRRTNMQLTGGSGGGLLAVQTFTSSGMYTPTAGTKKIIVELIGGGGSGASPVNASKSYQVGLGGLGGNYIKAVLTSNIKPMLVQVGAGGQALDNDGTDGGMTTLGNPGEETTQSIVAYGGLCGETLVVAALPIAGEYLSSGSTVEQAYGFQTISYKDGFDGGSFPIATEAQLMGGRGGDTPLGTGGNGRPLSTGRPGIGFGAGGGGGCAKANFAGSRGGNGSAGAVIIYEYS